MDARGAVTDKGELLPEADDFAEEARRTALRRPA
jgi:hypothetical protein